MKEIFKQIRWPRVLERVISDLIFAIILYALIHQIKL